MVLMWRYINYGKEIKESGPKRISGVPPEADQVSGKKIQ